MNRLVIIVQTMDRDNPVFGYLFDWINAFRNRVNQISVLALKKGNIPPGFNVEVLSMGKERHRNRLFFLFQLYRFVLSKINKNSSMGVLIIQDGPYPVLLWPLKFFYGIKLAQWKTHSGINLIMKMNLFALDRIFTASKTSFLYGRRKLRVVGHGVNLNRFFPINSERSQEIIVVGRITAVKNLELVLRVFFRLREISDFQNITLHFIGLPLTPKDIKYQAELQSLLLSRGYNKDVFFHGYIPYDELPKVYNRAKLSLSLGSNDSLDKVILESMACCTPVVMTTWALRGDLGEYEFLICSNDESEIVSRIVRVFKLNKKAYSRIGTALRSVVAKDHNLIKLAEKIMNELQEN